MNSRISARELAVRFVYELGYSGGKAIDEFLSLRLSDDYLRGLEAEDDIYTHDLIAAQSGYIKQVVSGVNEHWPELDGYIEKHAIGWEVGRMSRITASILRVSIYEILYMPDIPDSASIDAAVELAKIYESKEAASFINGILGSFWRAETGEGK